MTWLQAHFMKGVDGLVPSGCGGLAGCGGTMLIFLYLIVLLYPLVFMVTAVILRALKGSCLVRRVSLSFSLAIALQPPLLARAYALWLNA